MENLIKSYKSILNRKAVQGQNYIVTNGMVCITINAEKMLEQEFTNYPTQFDFQTASKICEYLNRLNETKCYILSYRDYYERRLVILEKLFF